MRLEEAPGGHLGVLTGRAARGTTWVLLDRFLAEHEARPRRRAPRRRLSRRARGYPGRPCVGRSPSPCSPSSIAAGSASAAAAQTPPPEERIRAGVTVSGVDVGNLTVAEATARLEQTLGPVLAQDVVVSAGRAGGSR